MRGKTADEQLLGVLRLAVSRGMFARAVGRRHCHSLVVDRVAHREHVLRDCRLCKCDEPKAPRNASRASHHDGIGHDAKLLKVSAQLVRP